MFDDAVGDDDRLQQAMTSTICIMYIVEESKKLFNAYLSFHSNFKLEPKIPANECD